MKTGRELTEKTSSISFSTLKPAAKKNTRTTSPETTISKKEQKGWKIPSPTQVLKHVYKDMSDRATSFVQEIVGKTEEGTVKKEPKEELLTPSSPDSTSSLEIRMEEE